jgi:serine/threonine protein kinase/tetratricopeptide (TPR) repeat protein
MNASQWERAREIFDSALDLPSDSRPEFLLKACQGDSVLRLKIQELLKASVAADSSSFLDSKWLDEALPAEPDFALQPGDVVCERFQIVRHLGDGGMGRVYEAYDAVEDAGVALKSLRPEIADNPEVLKRFRQEVRIAHRITHPNICRTHHLGHDLRFAGPSDQQPFKLWFLTMEYLEGETLQQIIKRDGPIPLPQALSIARQMADAIAAAHHIGAIHRDIKPGNVMICPAATGDPLDGRAVITDFGLAKLGPGAANPDLSSISHVGRPMGTLAYMSPEQLEAGQALPATDIYAFGLVLFEMVTGAKAFPDSNTLQTASQRITAPVPSPKVLVPNLPAEWEAAIVGCLQIDPAARLQQACDVIDVLEGNAPSPSHTIRRNQPAQIATPPPSRAKIFAIAAAVVVLLSLSWLAYRSYTTRTDATVAPGTLVYLAPVKNETGEKQLDNITELVRAGLEQSAHINLLDAGRVSDTLQRMTKAVDTPVTPAIAREIALRVNAPRIVFATLTKVAGSYRLNVDIQQPDLNNPSRPREESPGRFEWPANPSVTSGTMSPQMISALRNATDWIRLKVGETQKDILTMNESPEDATTNNWQALSAFAQAEQFDSQHKKAEAALALQDAVRIDPHFSLAYARLGDILFAINRDAEGIAAYRHALESSTERALSRKELDRVQGMFAIDSLDYETAIQAFRDYAAFYPRDYIGWAYPTSALRALRLDDQAITNLRRAVQLEPHRSFPILALADELIITGHSDEALHWAEELRKNGFEGAAIELSATIQFLNYDFAGANANLEQLKNTPDQSRRTRGYRTQLRIAAELGDLPAALRLANGSIQENIAHGEPAAQAADLLDRASLECQMKDVPQCLADVRQALSLDPGRRAFLAAEDTLGPAMASASAQQAPRIRQEIHGLEAQINKEDFGFVTRLMRLRAHAESFIADGKLAAGLAEMRKVSALDAPATTRAYLGRVLLQAANLEQSPSALKSLREDALKAYGVTALRPQFAWYDPVNFPPGFLADETEAYLRTAIKLQKFDLDTSQAVTLYSHLRPNSLKASRELQPVVRRAS